MQPEHICPVIRLVGGRDHQHPLGVRGLLDPPPQCKDGGQPQSLSLGNCREVCILNVKVGRVNIAVEGGGKSEQDQKHLMIFLMSTQKKKKVLAFSLH